MKYRSTTVIAVIHNGGVAIGADGQATMGNYVVKSNVKKIRKLQEGKIVVGFAGSTADSFTLLERFDEKLNSYGGNMKRAAIELAKDWRMDRYLRRLEAMMVIANKEEILVISGTGDVLEPDNQIAAAQALIIISLNEIFTGEISFILFLAAIALSMFISMVR